MQLVESEKIGIAIYKKLNSIELFKQSFQHEIRSIDGTIEPLNFHFNKNEMGGVDQFSSPIFKVENPKDVTLTFDSTTIQPNFENRDIALRIGLEIEVNKYALNNFVYDPT